jgi:glycerol uptake facilitator-like aquaporin
VNKYVMEFIGTFFLVLTIGMSVLARGSGVIAPLAIGSVLIVIIFAGGHISGGHYNRAVTLRTWMRSNTRTRDVAPYIIFEAGGALIAPAIVMEMTSASLNQGYEFFGNSSSVTTSRAQGTDRYLQKTSQSGVEGDRS